VTAAMAAARSASRAETGGSRTATPRPARPSRGTAIAGRNRTVPAGRLVPLGDGAVLALPDSGRVAVLNPAARFACEALVGGRPFSEVVGAYARRFGIPISRAERDLRDLRRGLRSLAREPSPAQAEPAGPAADAPADLRDDYAPGPRPVRLTIHGSPRLARLLRHLLEPARSAGSARVRLTVTRHRRYYDIRRDGTLLTRTDDLLLARSETLRHLLLSSHGRRRWLAFLHGAAVAGNGSAWLIAGSSGSGKSTLAASLLRGGFSLVTDDYAPLEAGSGLLYRVPFAMGVKDASIALLRDLLPALEKRGPRVRFRNREVRYVAPPMAAADRLPVAGLLFPLHDPRSRPSLAPLAPEQAFTLCAQGGGWFEGSPRRLAELVSWFRRKPAWLVTYPDSRSALDLLLPLLERKS